MTILPQVKGADRRGLGEIIGWCVAIFVLGTINLVQLMRGQFQSHNPEAVMLFSVIGAATMRISKGADQRSSATDAYNMAATMLKQALTGHELEIERILAKYVGPAVAQQLTPLLMQPPMMATAGLVTTDISAPHVIPAAVTTTTTTTATQPTTFEMPATEKPAEPKSE